MKRWFMVLLVLSALSVVLAGCSNGDDSDDAPKDLVGLLTEAADKIRAAETFRLEVRHSGADYFINTDLNGGTLVSFRRAVAQYVAEDRIQASASVLLAGITVTLDVYAQGEDQWWKLPATGWIDGDFAPGFDPVTLIGEDTGFQAALAALEELSYEGTATLEDGSKTYHLTGKASGPDVTALLVGLIEAEDTVDVEVYIDQDSHYPSRIVIIQPETVTEETPEPTTWTIDVYDIDAEPDLNPPADAAAEA